MAKRIMSDEERARRSEGAKRAKARLREDPAAFAQFKQRTAKAVSAQWQQDQTSRVKNMSTAMKAAAANMTAEQRRQKFGWMNAAHVTPEKKREVWCNSLKKWHDTAPRAIMEEMIERRTASIMKANRSDRVYDNRLPEDHPINAWLKQHSSKQLALDTLFQLGDA